MRDAQNCQQFDSPHAARSSGFAYAVPVIHRLWTDRPTCGLAVDEIAGCGDGIGRLPGAPIYPCQIRRVVHSLV